MNWDALGAIAETVGVIAIFVSLIYVAAQIRQSTQQFARSVEANQLAAFERNVESGNRIRELLILNPDLAALFIKGLESYKGLPAAEKIRFGMLMRNMFSAMQGAYVRQLLVEHDPTEFQDSVRVIDEILVNRGAQEWLAANKPDWRPVFRDLVDERLNAIKKHDIERDLEST